MSIRQRWKRLGYRYQVFVERQGFPIIMTVCVAVIVLSAVWAGQMDQTLPIPTPPVDQAQSAARLQQQSLAEVSPSMSPSPTPAPPAWQPPLPTISVDQGFACSRMTRSNLSGVWQVHDGVDLYAAYGDPVCAMAEGVVLSCTSEGQMGCSVTIDHGSGIVATYAALASTAGLRPDDPVSAGQTIGFVGSSMREEADVPHLHLRVTRDGRAMDPLLLWD